MNITNLQRERLDYLAKELLFVAFQREYSAFPIEGQQR